MPTIISLRDFCRANSDWVLETTEALVAIESPTTDKAAVDRCGATLAARLEAIGGRVTRLTAGTAATTCRSVGCGASGLLLDHGTVWPVGQLDRMPLSRAGGRLTAPAVRRETGIAIAMFATRALNGVPARPPHRHALDYR
jgi:glutamate carboxypeptidase